MTFEDVRSLTEQYVEGTYARFPLAIESGHGATCVDFDGKRYIDFGSGIGVNALGFADADWAAAVSSQAARVAHTSNLYYSLPGALVARDLCEKSGMKKVFFCNSGAEANEGAIKAARKWGEMHKGRDCCEIITLCNSFHGRTVATLAATGQDVMHTHFFPFPEGFCYVEPGDIANLSDKITGKTCAVMIELIQGEGGVVPLTTDFVQGVAALCQERDILLIVDEVQTGIGRTGWLYCYQSFGLSPDIVSSAKGLASGLPFGAVLFGARTAGTLTPGEHATTFGMNLVAAAGAMVVLSRLDNAFLNTVKEKGRYISDALSRCENVASVTGMGLMIGVLPKRGDARDIVSKCMDKGLIVLTAKNKVRLLPPLVISDAEINNGLAILTEVLQEVAQ
ncbi:MAG: acetylornithine transaminase [Oscillospiraceae bacterium]